MKYLRAANTARGSVLGTRIGLADRWWLRLRGLLGRSGVAPGEGLLLRPCRAVHMRGMRFPLDVAFLDGAGAVVAAYHSLPPGAHTRWHRGARDALELPAGTLAASATAVGDTIVCTEVEP
ncbi:MAG TPA: DUF192 domain-containing protein [Gemmatimonadales bacterium]|nr:DUF192 domain-containing protein [Gemmatimonadales bacterium]